MKAQKIILTITVVLIIIGIALMATIGINVKEDYRSINIISNYNLGMEFSKSKIYTFSVSDAIKETKIYDSEGNLVKEKEEGVEYTEENGYTTQEIKANAGVELTVENYKNNKKIVQKRLEKLGVEQYNLKLDESTGIISIELPKNEMSDKIASYLLYSGNLQLLDDETEEVLLDRTYFENSSIVYGSQPDDKGVVQYYVYLQVKYSKEGVDKLKSLSTVYVATTTQETNDAGEVTDVTNEKKVRVVLNGTSIGSTVITNIINGDNLAFCINYTSDADKFIEQERDALAISTVLNTGKLGIEYSMTNEEKENAIQNQTKLIAGVVLGVIFLGISIYSVIKYKSKGLFAAILEIGFIASLLLVLRELKIVLTSEGFLGIIVSGIINYGFLFMLLKNIKNNKIWKAMTKTMLEFLIKIMPIIIISVVFSFVTVNNVNSLGLTLVWGIMVLYLYNLMFTNAIYSLVGGPKNEK